MPPDDPVAVIESEFGLTEVKRKRTKNSDRLESMGCDPIRISGGSQPGWCSKTEAPDYPRRFRARLCHQRVVASVVCGANTRAATMAHTASRSGAGREPPTCRWNTAGICRCRPAASADSRDLRCNSSGLATGDTRRCRLLDATRGATDGLSLSGEVGHCREFGQSLPGPRVITDQGILASIPSHSVGRCEDHGPRTAT
jgi:hypothetical protein